MTHDLSNKKISSWPSQDLSAHFCFWLLHSMRMVWLWRAMITGTGTTSLEAACGQNKAPRNKDPDSTMQPTPLPSSAINQVDLIQVSDFLSQNQTGHVGVVMWKVTPCLVLWCGGSLLDCRCLGLGNMLNSAFSSKLAQWWCSMLKVRETLCLWLWTQLWYRVH